MDRDPCLVALASEANRGAKGMRTGPWWAQRMSIMRRLGEFVKAHGPEMSQGNAPLFIVSLKPAKSSAVHKGTAVADGGWGGAGSDASLGPSEGSGRKSHKADAANDAAGTAPRLQRDGLQEGPRCCATRVGQGKLLERNCAAAEGKFVERQSNRNALVVDWGAPPKTLEASPRRAERCTMATEMDATTVRKVFVKIADGERLAVLGARTVQKIMWHFGVAAHSIKRGAIMHAALGVIRHDLDPRTPTQPAKRGHTGGAARPCTVSGTLVCCFNQLREVEGTHIEHVCAMANGLRRIQKPRANAWHESRLLMGTAF
uniref:Uncharacterized protein n=1 Tax=Trypanosoma vivax (strain Y486) TaxID=1055687 RepID=G0TSS3_TRYVY|nr:conserved hypothetical protein, in T. vivax [Trypanosoma vivax Y486]